MVRHQSFSVKTVRISRVGDTVQGEGEEDGAGGGGG